MSSTDPIARPILFMAAFSSASPLHADGEATPAPPVSQWSRTFQPGILRPQAGESVPSTSVKLKITMRDGNKFKADLRFGGGRGFELEGTIAKTGSDNFRATISKVLEGQFEDAIVGRKIEGFCRNGVLQAKQA